MIREKLKKFPPFTAGLAPKSRRFWAWKKFLIRFPVVRTALAVVSLAWIHSTPEAAHAASGPEELAGTADQWQAAEKIWEAHRRFTQNEDWGKAREELEKIYQWKLNQGIHNHYFFSVALIRESERLQRKEKFEEASEYLNYAGKMAPDYAQVSLAQAQNLLSPNPFKGDHFFKALGTGSKANSSLSKILKRHSRES